MYVSVVICTRNRPDLICQAVRSVLANTYSDFDVVVIDQSDDARTGEVVRALEEQDPRLRYFHTPMPGLSRAYNVGIGETTGEVIAFTDDDCAAASDWISAIAAAFEEDASADLLYGQVLIPEELADRALQVPNLPFETAERISRDSGFRIIGMGANFAARRRFFDRIGGFDEMLGGGGMLKSSQDYDLQYRAYLAGAVTILRPEVVVEHYGIRNWDQWPAMVRAWGTGDGGFYVKHVRCGDLFALRLMVARFGRVALRELLLRLKIRRRPSHIDYLRGWVDGIRTGMRFSVDRRRRMYVAPTQNAIGVA